MLRIDPDLVIRKYVMNRINANKNWLSVLCGATGSGKSYFSLAICEKFFPKFTVDNIVFSVPEYLNKFAELDNNKRHGDILLYDEGQSYNSRKSMSENNIIMGEILGMIRFTRISSIFTLPNPQSIDINVFRLLHTYEYTMDIDRKTCPPWQRNRTGVKFYEIMHDAIPRKDSRDLPLRYPVMNVMVRNTKTGQLFEKTVKVKELWYHAPSEEIIEAYEQRKRRHFNQALTAARAKIRATETKTRNKMQMMGIDTGEQPDYQPTQPALSVSQETSHNTISEIIGGGH